MIVLDYETYYAKDFTLSKLTVEEYVRSPKFEIIGVSIKTHDAPAIWYPQPEVQDALDAAKLEDEVVCAHNAMFDGLILHERNGIKPGFWVDTLSMARALHQMTVGGSLAKLVKHYGIGTKGDEVVQALGYRYADFTPEHLAAYGRYCCNDADMTAQLYQCLIDDGFPQTELVSIDQTIRMFTEPMIELDRDLLAEHLASERARKEQLLHTVLGGPPTEDKMKMLRSNPQFAERLHQLGITNPPMKVSPSDPTKMTYAFAKTDKGMQALADSENEAVSLLVRARLGVKSSIEETRAERFLGIADRGTLPVDLNYYGAHTGRYSAGSKINIQNLPNRKGSNALRRSLLAPEGHVFVSADSKQIEARIVAWLAGQTDLVKAFADGRDVYCEFASDIYGGTVTPKHKEERFVGKTGILSLGYGAGGIRFQDMLRTQGDVVITTEDAYRVVDLYRHKYPKIPALWRKASTMLRNMVDEVEGRLADKLDYDKYGIVLPSGFSIQYPYLQEITKPNSNETFMAYLNNPREVLAYVKARMSGKQDALDAINWTKVYGGKAVENIVQALAALIIRRQARAMKAWKMVFQVHDELVYCPRVEDAADCAAALSRAMSKTPMWAAGLPLACEIKVGTCYGSLETVG